MLPLRRAFFKSKPGVVIAPSSPQLIKGSAFHVLARYLNETQGETGYRALLDTLRADDRKTVETALASEWYPEELHQRVLRGVFEVNAGGNLESYETIIDACTLLGVQTFARLILAMSSTAFMLRRAPTLWSVLRSGPANLTVEQDLDGSHLFYRGFPFFDDQLYRHYFRALLGSLVRMTSSSPPDVRIVEWTASSLNVDIRHPR